MIVLHRISSNHNYFEVSYPGKPMVAAASSQPQKHIDGRSGLDYYYLRKTNYLTTLPFQGEAGGRNYELNDREIVCTLETILTNKRKS